MTENSAPEYGVDYALTITLHPRLYKMLPDEQLAQSIPEIKKLLSNYRYSLVYEFTKSFNIHFHAIVSTCRTYSSVSLHLHNQFRRSKYCGNIYVRQIEDWDKWVNYLKKDLSSTRKLNNLYPVIQDDYSCLPGIYELIQQEQCLEKDLHALSTSR